MHRRYCSKIACTTPQARANRPPQTATTSRLDGQRKTSKGKSQRTQSHGGSAPQRSTGTRHAPRAPKQPATSTCHLQVATSAWHATGWDNVQERRAQRDSPHPARHGSSNPKRDALTVPRSQTPSRCRHQTPHPKHVTHAHNYDDGKVGVTRPCTRGARAVGDVNNDTGQPTPRNINHIPPRTRVAAGRAIHTAAGDSDTTQST